MAIQVVCCEKYSSRMLRLMSTATDSPTNWITVAESRFPWERDGLDFVRRQFPTHEPYRAWANFEFIAEDGSINEVDLLVFTPHGFFLIEIKSRPGRLLGDSGSWLWETDGKGRMIDNPLFAANAKAKRLRSLLQKQPAFRNRGQLPFVETLIFCSDPNLQCDLSETGRFRVCLRDVEGDRDRPARPGIMAAIRRRECFGLDPTPKGTHDRPMLRTVSHAMDQAGIRPSQRSRKVSDYVLEQLLDEGPGYQDWEATHVRLAGIKRRVRLYLVRTRASAEDRETVERAALREFQLLEMLQHPGILRTYGFTEHELGPALIFEHDPQAVRLDHFLAQRKDALSVDVQLDLIRQVAEAIRFAHEKKVVHRALCPQSILVTEADGNGPRIKIFNWQVGYRAGSPSSNASRGVTPTSHVDRLVEDASTAYMAPEALSDEGVAGEHLDVFSLGAVAYHLFSGEPPAANGLELSSKLRETRGLQISSVLNGAGENLQLLVQYSTYPEVPIRMDSVAEFLHVLDDVEDDLTTPEHDFVEDPGRAQKGDLLPGRFRVVKRLGQGASAVALLVERDSHEYVLKVANSPEHNQRLKDEAVVLQKLRHTHVVECCGTVEIADRVAILMRPVLVDRDEKRVETLGERLRAEGRLHVDLLQRFGEDLLGVVNFLEEQGIPHRDIKPDNIALGKVGRGDRLHLVLFDFSLSRTPADNIRAGTQGYLDPLLPLRKPPRWDLHAERYAAAATLYELATGGLLRWGDGVSDPSHLDCEITLDAELFDASLRDSLMEFFRKAFRRDPAERFDNAEEMLRAWRHCFEGIEQPGALSDHDGEEGLRARLAGATLATQIPELGLGTRATNALDRANILTVRELMTTPARLLSRLRGVGNMTRREILTAVRLLREHVEVPPAEEINGVEQLEKAEIDPLGIVAVSVDLLLQRVTQPGGREREATARTLNVLLGLDPHLGDSWPSQSDVARFLHVTRARVGQLAGKFQARWSREPAITRLRSDVVEILNGAGGVMTPGELAEAILLSRGSVQDEPLRTRWAMALARVAVEAERAMAEPRFLVRRDEGRVFMVLDSELADYAAKLGDEADRLADEDPLVSPGRAAERLRAIPLAPRATALSDARLLRLAVAASRHAALSSRQELYPRGMDAARALKLSQGALYGVRCLTIQQVRERVSSRYPHAAPLPGRPALDDLLRQVGLDFKWDPTGRTPNAGEIGCYASRPADVLSITSGSDSLSRVGTVSTPGAAGEITPEIADARQFEERLQRGIREGSFLMLLVDPRYYGRASRELSGRFSVEVVDVEGVFLEALRHVADKARVNWELVLRADAAPGQGDWSKLMLLVGRAMPLVEQRLASAEKTLLLTHAGLLGRYDGMDLLERLRDQVGRRDGIPGLWLLLPGDQQPLMDGKAVPILSPSQRARIPETWLENRHRAIGRMKDDDGGITTEGTTEA